MLKVSIITPCFNSAQNIRQTIESVLSQDYPNIEYWVIDGGSTDGTIEILKEFEGKINYISEKDAGIYDAINKGLVRVTGDIIGYIGADDFYPNKQIYSTVVKTMEQSGADAVFGDKQYVDPFHTEKVVRYWRPGKCTDLKWLWGWMPTHMTFYASRKLVEENGLYRTDFKCSGDYEWLLRALFRKNRKTVYIPQLMITMRAGGVSNASLKHRFEANMEDRKAWRVNGYKPFFWTVSMKPIRKIHQLFMKK